MDTLCRPVLQVEGKPLHSTFPLLIFQQYIQRHIYRTPSYNPKSFFAMDSYHSHRTDIASDVADSKRQQFLRFPDFPPEIRDMVWCRALRRPRDVHIGVSNRYHRYKSTAPVPALLHVNHRARQVSMKFYGRLFETMGESRPLNRNIKIHSIPGIFINSDYDKVCLDINAWLHVYWRHMPEKLVLKHISIDASPQASRLCRFCPRIVPYHSYRSNLVNDIAHLERLETVEIYRQGFHLLHTIEDDEMFYSFKNSRELPIDIVHRQRLWWKNLRITIVDNGPDTPLFRDGSHVHYCDRNGKMFTSL